MLYDDLRPILRVSPQSVLLSDWPAATLKANGQVKPAYTVAVSYKGSPSAYAKTTITRAVLAMIDKAAM